MKCYDLLRRLRYNLRRTDWFLLLLYPIIIKVYFMVDTMVLYFVYMYHLNRLRPDVWRCTLLSWLFNIYIVYHLCWDDGSFNHIPTIWIVNLMKRHHVALWRIHCVVCLSSTQIMKSILRQYYLVLTAINSIK